MGTNTAVEGIVKRTFCVLGFAEPQRQLRIEQWIAGAGYAGRELVGVRVQSLGELAQQLERRDSFALFQPRHVCRRADAACQRALTDSCSPSRLAKSRCQRVG